MAELFKDIKYIEDIKSAYIQKSIFSFLNERQALNIIIYNKQLQKIVGVDINEYKKVSGRYKIGEKNGKGKEYILSTDRMIFEGEYINGKRNGKGKEYDYYGKLRFEGEYLNGIRNGNGKEYYSNGNLLFDGKYIEKKRFDGKGYNKDGIFKFKISNGTGFIKIYDSFSGVLLFEGEYLNGKKNGKGREYDSHNCELKFEGEYLNGERHGKCREYNNNGELLFEGEYLNGKKWDGKGYNKNGDIEFEIK